MNDSGDEPDLTTEELAAVTTLLAEITDADRHRLEPPPSIWNAIVDTITADRDGVPDRELVLTTDGNGSMVGDLSPMEHQATTTISLAVRTRPSEPGGLPSDAGGWRRQWLPVAAAVAIAIVGGLVTWAFSDQIGSGDGEIADDQPSEPAGDVIAATTITNDGLPVPSAESGEARLISSNGRHHLDIDVPDLPPTDGYYELWILDVDGEGMVSLGVVTGDARFALPPNLDPEEYPVVDISVEPVDGDPSHSMQSIWRGVLDL